MAKSVSIGVGKSMIERKYRFHDDPHHRTNWCAECGLYYCWHPEVEGHRDDHRAMHKFVPTTEEILEFGEGLIDE